MAAPARKAKEAGSGTEETEPDTVKSSTLNEPDEPDALKPYRRISRADVIPVITTEPEVLFCHEMEFVPLAIDVKVTPEFVV